MNHQLSSISIFQTQEYHVFRMISGNRELNFKKIDNIIKDIQNGNNMLSYYPIQVREIGDTLTILDGQHRFFICQKLKLPVYYILVGEIKQISDIARINSNVEKWNYQNFINCYASQNNQNYIQLQNFINRFRFTHSLSVILLNKGIPDVGGLDDNLRSDFYEGRFQVNYLAQADSLARECEKFNKFIYWRDRTFISAIYKIREAKKITIQRLHEEFLKNPDLLVKRHNMKQYIYNLEEIVNKNKHSRIVIV